MAANVCDPLPRHPYLPPITAAMLKLGARPELALRSHSNSFRAASGSLLLTPGLIFSAQAFIQWKRLAQACAGRDLGAREGVAQFLLQASFRRLRRDCLGDGDHALRVAHQDITGRDQHTSALY